jgi:hypothetical protein
MCTLGEKTKEQANFISRLTTAAWNKDMDTLKELLAKFEAGDLVNCQNSRGKDRGRKGREAG